METTSDPDRVEHGLERLAQLLLRTETVPETVLQRARRLIRPTTHTISQGTHTNAVKLRMRRTLMNNTIGSVSGPENVTAFEKDVDLLHRRGAHHIHSFLALLEPLSSSASVANRLQMDRDPPTFSLLSTAPHTDISVDTASTTKPAATAAAMQPAPSFHSDSLLPFGPPPILSDSSIQSINNDLVWVPRTTELLLIRELLMIFQGINSAHIRLDDKTQSYVLHPCLSLPPPVRDVVLCLCEVGWLYIKVKGYIERVENSQGRGGLIAQAFAFSLQNALNDYYRLLAVLEQELSRASVTPPPPVAPPSNATVNEGTSGLTLLRLRAWMLEPMDRLHGHSHHGDDRLSNFVGVLMKSVSVPLYHMITRWVLHGELQDPYHEFFVAKSAEAGGAVRSQNNISADYLWHHYYKLNLSMLPSFVSSKLARKILVVGKSINFMKACLQHGGRDELSRGGGGGRKVDKRGNLSVITMSEALGEGGEVEGKEQDDGASVDVATVASAVSVPSGAKVEQEEKEEVDYGDGTILLSEEFESSLRRVCHSYGDETALSVQVHAIAAVIESRLLNMVLKKFNLFTHLAALKKFMLLGQGDFVTCLMDTVGGELKNRANQLFRHNLTGLLDGSLRSCNAQFEPSFVLDRLGVRLLEPSPGDSGWEIFSLDYAIDPPLAAVIHAEAISKYRIAFHMLWRLKRVEWALSGAWRNLFTFHHTRGHFSLTKLKPILHRCAVQRGKMTHFINSLNNFLMFEVVETAWVQLVSGVDSATCLDDIIRCHDQYLEEIQERALLSEEHESLNMQIQLVLQAILRFCNLEETMVELARGVAARKRHDGVVGWCARPGSDGTGGGREVAVTTDTVDGVPGYTIARLEEAAQDYMRQFDKMLLILQQQGEKCGHLMRFLTFRLDLDTSGQPGHSRAGWSREGGGSEVSVMAGTGNFPQR